MILSPISFQPDRSRINRAQINNTCVAYVFQGEREERPPLLPLPGASASGSGHNVPQRAHNTAELATGSVSVLLFRMLLPVAHGHGAECCLPAAAARARRRNCRHRGRLVADQWRDSTIPAGKPNGLPSGLLELEPVPIERKKKKEKGFRSSVAHHHFARAPCQRVPWSVSYIIDPSTWIAHPPPLAFIPLCLSCFLTGREGNPDA